MRLADKVAVVTGGGRGIGAAVCRAFAREGARVAVWDRDREPAHAVAAELAALGRKAHAEPVDVGDPASVEAAMSRTAEALGPVDILVTLAGNNRFAMLHKMTLPEWEEVVGVHLRGTFVCLQAAAHQMIPRNYGRIVTVTSGAGLRGTLGQINYSAAKAGILGLTKSAARELARYNITVNCISPAAATRMTETIRTDPKFRDKYLENIPLRRWAEPEEVAPAFVFLASDEASYITGEILRVDGGLSM